MHIYLKNKAILGLKEGEVLFFHKKRSTVKVLSLNNKEVHRQGKVSEVKKRFLKTKIVLLAPPILFRVPSAFACSQSALPPLFQTAMCPSSNSPAPPQLGNRPAISYYGYPSVRIKWDKAPPTRSI